MPPVSKLATLTPEVRDELNQRLIAAGFGDLDSHVEWLRSLGVDISRSRVGEYSLGLKSTIQKSMERARLRVEVARSMGGMSDSDKAALLETTEMVLLDKLMETVEAWEDTDPAERPKVLASLIRAGADLGRSSIGTAKLRKEAEAEIRRAAADAAAKTAQAAGVSPETIARIRRDVLGMAA